MDNELTIGYKQIKKYITLTWFYNKSAQLEISRIQSHLLIDCSSTKGNWLSKSSFNSADFAKTVDKMSSRAARFQDLYQK